MSFILLKECYHLLQYIFFETLSTYVEVTTKVQVILDFPLLFCTFELVSLQKFLVKKLNFKTNTLESY